jgi:hypothetical protein
MGQCAVALRIVGPDQRQRFGLVDAGDGTSWLKRADAVANVQSQDRPVRSQSASVLQ